MKIGNMIKVVEVLRLEVKEIRKTNTDPKLKAAENAIIILLENLKRANVPGANR